MISTGQHIVNGATQLEFQPRCLPVATFVYCRDLIWVVIIRTSLHTEYHQNAVMRNVVISNIHCILFAIGHTLNGQQVQPGLWDQFRDGVATLAPVRAIGAIYSAAYMGMMMLVL